MASILVTGGAGELGGHVISRLIAQGNRVRILTHEAPSTFAEQADVVAGDLAANVGLDAALAGMRVIIHLASDARQAQAVDVEGTRNLLAAAKASAMPPHIVYISIVGVDRSDSPYYVAKYATERLIQASGLPWSVLRATQFYSFVVAILRSLGIDSQPVVAVPTGVRFQSIDTGEVADRLVEIAELGPLGAVEDMGGPQILDLETMANTYVRARGLAARIHTEELPTFRYPAFRTGINLTPEHAVGVMTWGDYLIHARPD